MAITRTAFLEPSITSVRFRSEYPNQGCEEASIKRLMRINPYTPLMTPGDSDELKSLSIKTVRGPAYDRMS